LFIYKKPLNNTCKRRTIGTKRKYFNFFNILNTFTCKGDWWGWSL